MSEMRIRNIGLPYKPQIWYMAAKMTVNKVIFNKLILPYAGDAYALLVGDFIYICMLWVILCLINWPVKEK
jgi:hypothetical protein